jgi:antirestriction protein ArdC
MCPPGYNRGETLQFAQVDDSYSAKYIQVRSARPEVSTRRGTVQDHGLQILAAGFLQAAVQQSREELVAEIGAAFLCSTLGLSNEPREEHAAYLSSWLKVLKQDKRAIFTAASQAQKAVDWMHARNEEQQSQAA